MNGYEPVSYSFKQPPKLNLPWYYGLATLQSDSLKPNCTAVDFPVNSQFFTNQSGLTYTLDAVWTDTEAGSGGGGQSPSLSYSNEPFRNCSIFLINMDMEELDRDANQVLTAPWGLIVRAFTTCTLQDKATGLKTYVNLTTAFDAVPQGNSLPQLAKPKWLVATNRYHRASLWWGESLLTAWWANISLTMTQTLQVNGYEQPFRKAAFQWMPNINRTNILDSDFLLGSYSSVVDEGNGDFSNIFLGTLAEPLPFDQLGKDQFFNSSLVFFELDRLAKSMYSTVLVDLGQDVPADSNVLLSGHALQQFTAGLLPYPPQAYLLVQAGPAEADYEALKDSTGALGVTPSVISTTYSCQLPTRKSTGSLILSILVADLVLLQLAWTVYTFVVGFCMRKRHRVNYCEGCLKETVHMDKLSGPVSASNTDVASNNSNCPLLQSDSFRDADHHQYAQPRQSLDVGGGRSDNFLR